MNQQILVNLNRIAEYRNGPADRNVIDAAEAIMQIKFPNEYRVLLTNSNGLFIKLPSTWIEFLPVIATSDCKPRDQDVISMWKADQQNAIEERAPVLQIAAVYSPDEFIGFRFDDLVDRREQAPVYIYYHEEHEPVRWSSSLGELISSIVDQAKNDKFIPPAGHPEQPSRWGWVKRLLRGD